MRTAPTSGGTRVAAVMAAYNRRELTLACLRSLGAQQVPGVALDVFVLDDASSDATSEAVGEQFPEVTVLHGNGELYWNGGMRRAIAGDYDYYLWMNDDTSLDDGGLAVLLDWRPLRAELVEPGDTPCPCDATNGNATLMSRAVVQRIGNIDPAFVQRLGDFDYGLRARAAGCSVWVAPGTVETCASHPKRRTDEQPLGEELRRIWSLKQLKPGPWAVYSRRWAGRFWPMYWLSPYVRGGLRLVLQRIPPARRGAV